MSVYSLVQHWLAQYETMDQDRPFLTSSYVIQYEKVCEVGAILTVVLNDEQAS